VLTRGLFAIHQFRRVPSVLSACNGTCLLASRKHTSHSIDFQHCALLESTSSNLTGGGHTPNAEF
jgi:hypothetical protein